MNANIDRVDTESLPPRGASRTRYACAICVHPFLFAFICVFPCLPDQRRERLPTAIVTPRRNDPHRVQSIRMVIAPPWPRPRSCLVAAAWLRCVESLDFLLAYGLSCGLCSTMTSPEPAGDRQN